MNEKESIKEEIVEYVKESSRTFVELEDKFPILRSKSGNDTHVELHYPLKEVAKSNIIVWELSVLGGEIITELVNEKKIQFKPMDSMSRLCYTIDGGGLNLPMANRPTKQGYKEPHWLPCWVVTYENWLEWKKN